MPTYTITAAELEARLRPIDGPVTVTATATPTPEGWSVTAHVGPEVDVDRKQVYAWGLGPSHARLAQRLVAAVNAGAIFSNFRTGTDIDGHTYVTATCAVLGRTLNADLRRLGF